MRVGIKMQSVNGFVFMNRYRRKRENFLQIIVLLIKEGFIVCNCISSVFLWLNQILDIIAN